MEERRREEMDSENLNPSQTAVDSALWKQKGTETSGFMKRIKSWFSPETTPTFAMFLHPFVGSEATLYEVKVDQWGRVTGGSIVARFFDKSYKLQSISALGGVCIRSKLYMLVSGSYVLEEEDDLFSWVEPVCGFVYDLKTRKLDKFKDPKKFKTVGVVIYAYGKIYYLLAPPCCPTVIEDSFERYDPITDSWESLEPFPYSSNFERSWTIGHAVCKGYILLSICSPGNSVFAYHLSTNSWAPVSFDNQVLWTGTAVVLDDTVYAIKPYSKRVVIFSVSIDTTEEGQSCITLSKLSVHLVLGVSADITTSDGSTGSLTHLGGLLFCLFQSSYDYGNTDRQVFYITTFLFEEGNNIKILNSYTRDVEGNNLSIAFSFSEDLGQCGDNTTLVVKHNQIRVGLANQGTMDVPSETRSYMPWSSWAMSHVKVLTCCGAIPLVIVMGLKYCKPASAVISRMLTRI